MVYPLADMVEPALFTAKVKPSNCAAREYNAKLYFFCQLHYQFPHFHQFSIIFLPSPGTRIVICAPFGYLNQKRLCSVIDQDCSFQISPSFRKIFSVQIAKLGAAISAEDLAEKIWKK
ncbi:conserved hypothetical protein [Trichinella spiralis]|uniref:hypothetical protein n=1 Tax=Trichinella spiralis TaxID=6334 RepID=UPI0001EFDDF4|nr:conserved hypothetical protein [Trichinella spiralis]